MWLADNNCHPRYLDQVTMQWWTSCSAQVLTTGQCILVSFLPRRLMESRSVHNKTPCAEAPKQESKSKSNVYKESSHCGFIELYCGIWCLLRKMRHEFATFLISNNRWLFPESQIEFSVGVGLGEISMCHSMQIRPIRMGYVLAYFCSWKCTCMNWPEENVIIVICGI